MPADPPPFREGRRHGLECGDDEQSPPHEVSGVAEGKEFGEELLPGAERLWIDESDKRNRDAHEDGEDPARDPGREAGDARAIENSEKERAEQHGEYRKQRVEDQLERVVQLVGRGTKECLFADQCVGRDRRGHGRDHDGADVTNRERTEDDLEGEHHPGDWRVEACADTGTGTGRHEALHLVETESRIAGKGRSNGTADQDDRALSTT